MAGALGSQVLLLHSVPTSVPTAVFVLCRVEWAIADREASESSSIDNRPDRNGTPRQPWAQRPHRWHSSALARPYWGAHWTSGMSHLYRYLHKEKVRLEEAEANQPVQLTSHFVHDERKEEVQRGAPH